MVKEGVIDIRREILKYGEIDSAIQFYKDKINRESQKIAEQLLLHKRAESKLPSFHKVFCNYTKRSFEQSSSEAAAMYKAELFKGDIMLDLTGGLGADDYAFSKSFTHVISADIDPELNEIARSNFDKLGAKNIERITADAYDYIKSISNKFDLIYIDADRRTSDKKGVRLDDTVPNILKITDKLLELSDNILMKLSPLADLTYLRKTLPEISEIHVAALHGEVKEILAIINNGNKKDIAVEIDDNGGVIHEFSSSGKMVQYGIQGEYFYVPSPALIKAGLVESYAAVKGLRKISKLSPYLTGDETEDFFGRWFITEYIGQFSKNSFKNYIREKGITKANISARNFPLKPEEIKKMFRIDDGGEDYLFFTNDNEKEKLFFLCRKAG